MRIFFHPSERGIDPGEVRPGRHIATGQRCFCFSSSDAKTSDNRATATDKAQSQTGSNNVQAKGKARVQQIKSSGKGALAAGDNSVSVGGSVSAGNVSAAQGATVSVGLGGAELGNLVDKLTTASSNQISSVVSALAPSGPASPAVAKLETSTGDLAGNRWLGPAALLVGVVVVWKLVKK